MKRKVFFLLAMVAAAVSGCCQGVATEQVDAATLSKRLQGDSVQLVDVRTAEEYATGHIGQAVCIDVRQADFEEQAERRLDKERAVCVYCRSGRRSTAAAARLAAQGYRTVNLKGGIEAWQKAGLPIQH